MADNAAFVVPQSVIEQAVPIMARHAAEWPVDDWYSLGPDWDLNLYRTGPDEHPAAALYKVVDGQTLTDKWYPLAPLNMMFSRGLPMPH